MEQKEDRIENEAVETETFETEAVTGSAQADGQPGKTAETVQQEAAVEPTKETESTEVVQPAVTHPPKPANKKKLLTIAGAAAAAVIVVFVILFITVIRPNSIYKDACYALEKQDFVECQELLDKIPNHKNASALSRKLNLAIAKSYIENGEFDLAEGILAAMPGDTRGQELKMMIIYKRAAEAIAHEKYDEAQEYMDKIPNAEDPEQLRSKLTYYNALQYVEKGDYETGYEMISSLGDYEDAAKQKEMIYYEALAFFSLLEIQGTLKNPSSLRVTEVAFFKNKDNPNELSAAHEITASNSYGGSVGGFVYHSFIYEDLKAGENRAGMIEFSSYNDPDTDMEILESLIVYTIRQLDEFDTGADVARMNRLLENKVTFKVDLDFQSGETVEH